MAVTGSASQLEGITRWLGLAIAVVGALLANPDATAHRWGQFRSTLRARRHQVRGLLARALPFLRRSATVRVPMAAGSLAGVLPMIATVTGRALVVWRPDESTDRKIEILDERTKALDRELGELQSELRSVERRTESRLNEAVDLLRREVSEVRGAVDALRGDSLRTDASALPLIVLGVLVSGIAPESEHVPTWLWALLLIGATVYAYRLAAKIMHEWTPQVDATESR